jgi:hypothetical protein
MAFIGDGSCPLVLALRQSLKADAREGRIRVDVGPEELYEEKFILPDVNDFVRLSGRLVEQE